MLTVILRICFRVAPSPRAAYPTYTDTSKNWTPNQWVGYGVKRVSDGTMGTIVSNTNNTFTVATWMPLNWTAGNAYEFHKVLRVLDQPGLGRGDLITGTPAWPNPDSEPCYSWNNVFQPNGHHMNFDFNHSSFTTILQGRDYFNDTPMPGYTPYTYPHPLVTGQQPPAASATSSSQRYLNKSSKRKGKKLKTWK